MRFIKILSVLALALAMSAACGKSEEEKAAERAAEETREAAEALKKAAEAAGTAGAAQGLEEFAKAMEGVAGAMSGTGPDGKPVEPVGFDQLQTALPEMAGWDRSAPTGERMTMPVPFSQTEADYSRGDSTITVRIVDSGFSQMLVAPWAMFLTAGYEKQTGDGYEKSVVLNGQPGFERLDRSTRDAELNLVVAKRFLVTIEGRNVADTAPLHEFASKIDTARLAALK